MRYIYKTVKIDTFAGLKKAERLHIKGYKFIFKGMDINSDRLIFEIPKKSNE